MLGGEGEEEEGAPERDVVEVLGIPQAIQEEITLVVQGQQIPADRGSLATTSNFFRVNKNPFSFSKGPEKKYFTFQMNPYNISF